MEAVEKSWHNNAMNGSPTPLQKRASPLKKGVSTRLYRAPQSTVRRKGSPRRRKARDYILNSPSVGSRKSRTSKPDRDSSDSSCSLLETLEPPRLWMEDDVDCNRSVRSSSEYRYRKANAGAARRQGKRRYRAGDSFPDRLNYDEESITQLSHGPSSHHDDNHSQHSNTKSKAKRYQRNLKVWWSRSSLATMFIQVAVVFSLVCVVVDSRHKVRTHKQQMDQYDEERAHILEQMTWIDTAAKKVHKKYSKLLPDEQNAIASESRSELVTETKELREKLDEMQIRIQQNARDHTEHQFGDKPVQVSLVVGDSHLVIALSDDTPHAASTFLQQVGQGSWDAVEFQRLQHGRVIQASTKSTSTTPVLEFVEKSRGCHQVGAVAAHQLESDEFRVLVLKIHMEENGTTDEGDVCIGNIIAGLEALEQIIPSIPTIRTEEEAATEPILKTDDIMEENR